MKQKILINVTLILFLFVSSTFYSQAAYSLKNSSYTYVKSNLEFLASDELEGRETTTRGEKLAALYISEELEKYGVKPFGDNGTYFQDFNMLVKSIADGGNITFLSKNQWAVVFENGSDAVYYPFNLPSDKFANKEVEIVFVGYGITSEEDNYDSYANIDVKGKAVLVLNGTPQKNGEEILGKSSLRKFRRTSGKTNIAKTKGAVGLITLPNSEVLEYWGFLKKWSNSKSYNLEEEFKEEDEEHIPTVILNENAAKTLFANEEQSFGEVINNQDIYPESFELSTRVNFSYKPLTETKIARNVIGIIDGKNENLKNEFVTIGAHYDHEGINGEDVYNGADDNGSGTVTILETARRLAIEMSNERPILVIFHTAEEKGLNGSKYLVNNSEFVENIIVHINVDMVGRLSEDSIHCVGASKISTELGKIIENVNLQTTNFFLDYTFDNPNDPNRFYYRSDHVHYANKGIPIAFFYDYMQADYHKPTDTVEKINFVKIVKMVELLEKVVLKISNLDHKLSIN